MLTLPEKDRVKYALLHTILIIIAIPAVFLIAYILDLTGIETKNPFGRDFKWVLFISYCICCFIGSSPYYPKFKDHSLFELLFSMPTTAFLAFIFPYLYITNIILVLHGIQRCRKEAKTARKDMTEKDE